MDLGPVRLPGDIAAHSRHRVVEGGRRLNTLRRHADHSLGPSTPLRRRIAHPCLEEAFRLQTIEGSIKCAYGAAALGCGLNLLPDRRAVRSSRYSNSPSILLPHCDTNSRACQDDLNPLSRSAHPSNRDAQDARCTSPPPEGGLRDRGTRHSRTGPRLGADQSPGLRHLPQRQPRHRGELSAGRIPARSRARGYRRGGRCRVRRNPLVARTARRYRLARRKLRLLRCVPSRRLLRLPDLHGDHRHHRGRWICRVHDHARRGAGPGPG